MAEDTKVEEKETVNLSKDSQKLIEQVKKYDSFRIVKFS